MPPKSGCCKTCRRDFGEKVKQKGTLAQCSGCFYFIKGHMTYRDMSRSQMQQALQDPEKLDKYLDELQEWEENRKEGKIRRGSAQNTVSVTAESRSSLVTRSTKGYLWSKDLLEKHGEGSLFKKGKTTTVTHMGSKLTGILRDKWVLGAVEIIEDSSCSAVRANVAAEGDAMDTDAFEESNEAFQGMSKQLKSQVDEDGDGSLCLKPAHKKAKEDHDDFMDLWGLASAVGGQSSGQAEKGNRNRAGSDGGESRKPKKAKVQHAAVGGGGPSNESTETSSQAPASSSLSSQWMFSGRLSKVAKPRMSEHSKDFDITEKAIQAAEALKVNMSHADSFLAVTYQKARTVYDKLASRNTEALQAMYRESGQSGEVRGLDLLRRVTAGEKEMQCILDVVAALHDSESSSETLSRAVEAARLEGVDVPKCTDQLCRARLLNELAKDKKWEVYCEKIDPQRAFETIFATDEEDQMLDFCASSLISTLKSLLMREIKVTKTAAEPGEAPEKVAEEEQKQLEAAKVTAAEDVLAFINAFLNSPAASSWMARPVLASFSMM